ncbi:hypothetical protein HP439_09970 [Sphingobacterium shayense]|uniref:hypothetical protein n=1 Tax=Sphingobacterium shayense TaxID=626343 RepID=UPI001557FFBC|nr:hypothetical protein [Sphingobacterium shayense]NQD71044.1 hypothetical protein [Sphingobacterium shayense]
MRGADFEIATLHRGKYMLVLLAGLCVVTVLVSQLSIQEILKIIIVLLSVPLLLFLGTKWSANPSRWRIDDRLLSINFKNDSHSIDIQTIKYIRNVPRSGGNLIMIFFKDARQPKRYWRNKLFQNADDLESLIHALKMEGIEYYYA